MCNGSITADHNCFQKSRLLLIITIGQAQLCHLGFRFRLYTGKSNFQDFAILHRNMAYAVIKIIARCENVMFHSKQCLRLHIGGGQLTCCLSLPICIGLLQLRLGLV